jgi:uncharacterized protein with PIN domain
MASYGVELTGKEIIYFFFKKKRCPICGDKMKKEKKVESLGEGFDSIKLGEYYYGERHEVTLFYRCNKCEKLYSIGELSGETK